MSNMVADDLHEFDPTLLFQMHLLPLRVLYAVAFVLKRYSSTQTTTGS